MKKWIALAGGLMFVSGLGLATPHTIAGERYSVPPAVKLSPDLTGSWVIQLDNKPHVKKRKAVKPKRKAVRSKPVRKKTQRASYAKPKKKTVRREAVTPRPVKTKKAKGFDPKFLPQMVSYNTNKSPGSIVIDTQQRFLYLVLGNGKARRYGVGVGKQGFEWKGTQKVSRKAEWPSWTPPKEMIAREAKKGRHLPDFMPGGPENPMGARALYLGSTLYRIHGTNQPWSIGLAVSSGCIRMRNEDVMDLYERVKIGAKVQVI